ncbi:hypothetical protein EK0264_06920 [Epidermidibacterium keratini]|uniref:Uncharacterized protein n=1 Tax=Epidermidibacterium keratini TaxID=1891644 RepID=A0A7L4YMC9_9ACTN|nr:hypothetical protein [Epidermidibacterium keratini]QHC00033.1 hypothetical protein EK0264_06920 [Epidermidibacterium keratini]
MPLATRTQPIAVGAGVLALMGAVYAGQQVALEWARKAAEPEYPQAAAYFTEARIAAVLEVADEQAGTDGTAYSVQLSNDGSALVSVCFPDDGGLLRYDVSSDGEASAAGGGADCSGGFDATAIGAGPMLAALEKSLDSGYDGAVSAAYNAQGGLTPVVEIGPAGQPLQRYTLGGTRIGKIVDVGDPVDIELALDAVIAESGVSELQSVCLDLLEPQVAITGQDSASDAATVSAWRYTNFVQRMPSATARGGLAFNVDDLDLAAILARAPQVELLFESTPKAKKICVESAAAAPLVRYELMNGMRTTAHQVWTSLDGAIIAQE